MTVECGDGWKSGVVLAIVVAQECGGRVWYVWLMLWCWGTLPWVTRLVNGIRKLIAATCESRGCWKVVLAFLCGLLLLSSWAE